MDTIISGWEKEIVFKKKDFEIIFNKAKSSNYLLFYKKICISTHHTLKEADKAADLLIGFKEKNLKNDIPAEENEIETHQVIKFKDVEGKLIKEKEMVCHKELIFGPPPGYLVDSENNLYPKEKQ